MKGLIEVSHEGKPFRVAWSFASLNDVNHDLLYASLDREELKTVSKFPSQSRVKEFTTGRWCAKEAFALYRDSIIDAAINIGIGSWGYPYIEGSDEHISIAHTDKHVIAICASGALPIGIDIEDRKTGNDALILTQVSEAEKRMLHQFSSESEGLHILWGGKEAAAKALRTGFRLPMSLFEVSKVTQVENVWHITFDNLGVLTASAVSTGAGTLALALPAGAVIVNGLTGLTEKVKNTGFIKQD